LCARSTDRRRLYPFTFEPELRSYIWGGRSLEALGRRLPAGVIAESWEISGHPAAPTRVTSGPLAGHTLASLVAELGEGLLGRCNRAALARQRFPLLVKLLDAAQKLSIQVHPPDAYAAEYEGGEWGKTELWYFLQAEPAAQIIHGLRAGVTPAGFRQAVEAGAVERCLRHVPVHAGDAVLVGAGTVHALLGGTLVVEIQQTCDLTYRVYDWSRPGADGRPRPLQIDKALDVIDFGRPKPALCRPTLAAVASGYRRERLCAHTAFCVERLSLGAGARYGGNCAGESFEIWGCVGGVAQIAWAGGVLPLPAVQFALLPATLGEFAVEAAGPAVLLRTTSGRNCLR